MPAINLQNQKRHVRKSYRPCNRNKIIEMRQADLERGRLLFFTLSSIPLYSFQIKPVSVLNFVMLSESSILPLKAVSSSQSDALGHHDLYDTPPGADFMGSNRFSLWPGAVFVDYYSEGRFSVVGCIGHIPEFIDPFK